MLISNESRKILNQKFIENNNKINLAEYQIFERFRIQRSDFRHSYRENDIGMECQPGSRKSVALSRRVTRLKKKYSAERCDWECDITGSHAMGGAIIVRGIEIARIPRESLLEKEKERKINPPLAVAMLALKR